MGGLVGAVAAGMAAWLLWPSTEVLGVVAEASAPTRAAGAPRAPTGPVESGQGAEVEPAPVVEGFARRVEAVAASCGLDAQPVCEGATCVVLLEMPDMESPLGWAEVLWRSPRFVLSTAARDLGLSEDLLPCGVAIDGLSGGATVVESPGGEELWCTGDGPGVEALCEQVSGVEGFAAPDARRLSFRR